MNRSLSTIVNWLRFPLACLIVVKHYYTPDISSEIMASIHGDNYSLYNYVGTFFTHIFPAFAVPLFFFISGYLYFVKYDKNKKFDLGEWKDKTIKRIKSLLIPYLSWNLLVLLLFAVVQFLSGSSETMDKDGYKLIVDYGVIDYAKAFYAIDSTGMPIDGPLWFVRDLFLVSVFLSYPIYLVVTKLKIYGLILLAIVYFTGLTTPVTGIGMPCVFFFTFGGYCAINKFTLFINVNEKIRNLLGGGILASLCFFAISYYLDSSLTIWAKRIYIVMTVFFIFGWLGIYERKHFLKEIAFFSASSFFIFAIHKPILVIIRRGIFAVFNPSSELILIALCVIIPILVIFISLLAFFILKKYLPFLKFLNGSRL